MSEEQSPEIIIVRRRVEGEDGHHGGAWKIAYADFVTAMMAFFLVLWILNSTNKDSQTIIARYFNPVKMEDFAKNKKGIRDQQDKEVKPGANEGLPDKAPPAGPQEGKMELRGKDPDKDVAARALMNEETLFQNPYAALDQIAGRAPQPRDGMTGSSSSEQGSLDAFHDPFRAPGVSAETDDADGATGVADQSAAPPSAPPPQAKAGVQQAEAPARPSSAAAKRGGAKSPDVELTATKAAEAAQAVRASALQKEIVREEKAAAGANGPRVEVRATDQGLLISLTDSENFGMFQIGSSAPNPKLVHLMERIAKTLKAQPGAVVLRGYTDARRYRNGAYDNWRLSASRAQMALYMLVRGGLPESRIERVEGYADRRLKNPKKPEAAENRRIEILLRKAPS
ncbi:MotB family protein [Rhodoblastus acidophilus]|uniref:MotB family protein n=1 Tax=Candidatus Rhodoblastus alkanivorans TaxID=2954117 RepID=A0ABS9Z3H2_9HYPH|nr:MotB family protein [Candidatus Rhodoblastus alkanivorans]MCI4678836.1 MotB family protein [Candidatus Rhodoblastus alkanivorans]MCI4682225.1 MotB family protein [Candidatus Rhodoblastus alkanivorans]MDI4639527.1 MotB family protein [Rhodoblastus acidophilus]